MIQSIPELRFRQASTQDISKITKLLAALHLPTDELSSHIEHFLVSESKGEIIRTISLKIYNKTALLRSIALVKQYQKKGIGNRLFNIPQNYAQEIGIREIMLLTTTAKEYFIGKRFDVIEREAVNEGVFNSVEFRCACPSTTTAMKKVLG
jgi:N-acetylglutamate synthase-like GNAT family acetyltransferase